MTPQRMLRQPGARARVIPLPDGTFTAAISLPRYYPKLNVTINTVEFTGCCRTAEYVSALEIENWRAAS